MNRPIRLLIVEDEAAIRTGLEDVFVYHGYQVKAVADGQQGLQEALSGCYDLIVLDVMLPKMDGFEICNRIRGQDRDQAIIMLTARSSDEDIIQGLTLGADDYVAKPFSVAQLVLRVQAVLRRSGVGVELENLLRISADLEVDIRNLSGRSAAACLSFTRREVEILQYLYAHADRPVPRDELLAKVWGYAKHLQIETRTVDIHIAKLRRKIEVDSAVPKILVTVRGAGYRLMAH